ncbi:unnamed protein product [Didymodactylos carnosus]|uniref:F-box domain-containing protein n=1 Tax=Didymodactylos carnosus TaxID=1234261 RepID=A0A814IZM0_9BILA|nr:unnamed protein product [Didymodactylos carnosus]CAF1031348.1 unnamed protein product [Didymodactylos carnosus]CAF3688643.1 unnamed protein product [Didymodactylos carnosus]CAF3802132.1 unnamed protein product [Didymodactylos carnosus]
MSKRTKLEDLSDELYFELFEYLNVCDLHESLFNLNSRLNQIILDRRLCLHGCILTYEQLVYFSSKIQPYLENSEQTIISLQISGYRYWQQLFSNHIYLSIRSLTVNGAEELSALKSLLISKHLPFLKHLTITATRRFVYSETRVYDLIYTIISQNQTLTTCVFDFHFNIRSFRHRSHETQFSHLSSIIERLNLRVNFNLKNFSRVIKQLPNLRFLEARIYGNDNLDNFHLSLIQNLTYLILSISCVPFLKLERILSMMSNLKKLHIKGYINLDTNYLKQSYRWKQLLTKKLSLLKQFRLSFKTNFILDSQCLLKKFQQDQYFQQNNFYLEEQPSHGYLKMTGSF